MTTNFYAVRNRNSKGNDYLNRYWDWDSKKQFEKDPISHLFDFDELNRIKNDEAFESIEIYSEPYTLSKAF